MRPTHVCCLSSSKQIITTLVQRFQSFAEGPFLQAIQNNRKQPKTYPGGGGAHMTVQLCQHQFSDHTTCEAVALRNLLYCKWHRTAKDRLLRADRITRQPRHRPISLTVS